MVNLWPMNWILKKNASINFLTLIKWFYRKLSKKIQFRPISISSFSILRSHNFFKFRDFFKILTFLEHFLTIFLCIYKFIYQLSLNLIKNRVVSSIAKYDEKIISRLEKRSFLIKISTFDIWFSFFCHFKEIERFVFFKNLLCKTVKLFGYNY